MSWFILLTAMIAVGLTYLDVGPFWLQLAAYAVALALFLMRLPSLLPGAVASKKWFAKRAFLLVSLLFLLMINLFCRQYDRIFDFSKSRIYSLRPTTISWIKKISEPIQIFIFLRLDDKTFHYAEWLQKQIREHTDKITVEIKNINRDISFTKRYGIKQSGEIALVSGDQWVKVGDFKEETLIQGIVRLLSKSEAVLCFLTGHGEAELEDAGSEGLGGVRNFLVSLGYKLRTVSLLEEEGKNLASGCSLLGIISPKIQFFPVEEERLLELHKQNLPLLIAVDPPVAESVSRLLENLGLTSSNRPVINKKNPGKKFSLTDIFLRPETTHLVTNDIVREIYLPESQSFISNGKEWTPLLRTPVNEDYSELGLDSKGPYSLIFASEGKSARYLVLGSGKGLRAQYLTFGDTQKFIHNGVRWLLNEEGIPFVSLRGADEKYMTLSESERFWVKTASFYLYPGLGFLLIFAVWSRRNLLG